jgi:hypothetical protein
MTVADHHHHAQRDQHDRAYRRKGGAKNFQDQAESPATARADRFVDGRRLGFVWFAAAGIRGVVVSLDRIDRFGLYVGGFGVDIGASTLSASITDARRLKDGTATSLSANCNCAFERKMRTALFIFEYCRDDTASLEGDRRCVSCGNAIYALCGRSAQFVLHHLARGVQR